nr:MAG TPA: hypothetical protein [Caudoviricetes sp.]
MRLLYIQRAARFSQKYLFLLLNRNQNLRKKHFIVTLPHVNNFNHQIV